MSSGSGTRRHVGARHHRRRRLQRRGGGRPLRLGIRAAGHQLAHVARARRRIELLVALLTLALFQVPDDQPSLTGARFDRAALRASLASRDLWIYGLALLGGYGGYFTVSQLFSEYATQDRHLNASAGGLLSALILLAGIPGSLLGGYWADRSQNLRVFIVGPLVAVAVLLALIPAVPTAALWALGIGIGFFLIFGFAAWLAVPARVSKIEHQFIGTATGVMLTLAAIGGFFIPIIFGHLVAHTSFAVGWLFLAAVAFGFAVVGVAGHNPERAHQAADARFPIP